jgi:uncharacterized protein (TIGR04141 family)
MRNNEPKSIVSFYKIDKQLFLKISEDEIIEKIMENAEEYYPETKFKREVYNNYSIVIYYSHPIIKYNKWEAFFSSVLDDKSDTFSNNGKTKFVGKYLSFVSFLYNKDDLFALCMGKGYLVIERFIVDNFGFELLTRLIKPDSPLLRQTTANNLSGAIFEDVNVFRSAESFTSQDDFGKIFKQAISELDRDAITMLGMDPNKIESANCMAKSSFMLKTGITLDQVTSQILPALTKIFKKSNSNHFQINKVRIIGKNHSTYDDLKKRLYAEMRKNFLQFDFFSPEDAVSFFTAEKYSVSKYSKKKPFDKSADSITTIEQIYKAIDEDKLLDFNDDRAFAVDIENVMVNAYDDNDKSLLRHQFSIARGMHGEFEFKGNRYFWLNAKFYKIDQDFLKSFNERIFQAISQPAYQIAEKITFEDFDLTNDEQEGDYNSKHTNKINFINLDKKLGSHVELCDLLYEGIDTVYLVHVKKGFDRDIRVLTSQILTAQRFLYEDRDNYLKAIYDSKKGDQIRISETQFLDKFTKRIVFVFAFVHEVNIFDKCSFVKLQSNIAKLEILTLLKDFKKFSPPYDLKVIQLPSK